MPFIVITGRGNEAIAIEMMKLGAQDYIVKGTNVMNDLPTIIKRTINKLTLESKLEASEKALKNRVEELSALHMLSRKIGTNLELKCMVNAALEGIVSIINPDMTLLFNRYKENLLLLGIKANTLKYQHTETKTHYVGECLCGLAVSSGMSVYSKDIFSDSRCTWEECKKAGLKSFAALPLIINGEIIGVLGLASGTETDFEERDSFLETLAGQVAIGLENARLYEQVKEKLIKSC
ncbi:MAG: GAF domain-containing protein [Nitrospiraceae bacterium]|nr:MAG: GAF domain-containing protein [Nitrospiraceae bacterium]